MSWTCHGNVPNVDPLWGFRTWKIWRFIKKLDGDPVIQMVIHNIYDSFMMVIPATSNILERIQMVDVLFSRCHELDQLLTIRMWLNNTWKKRWFWCLTWSFQRPNSVIHGNSWYMCYPQWLNPVEVGVHITQFLVIFITRDGHACMFPGYSWSTVDQP